LSTLTKVLIILLTLSSIFLCGIVVTYVSNATNYQKKYSDERTAKQAAQSEKTTAKEELTRKSDQFETDLKKLNTQITELKQQIADLGEKNKAVNRALSTAKQNAANSAALAKTASDVGDALQKTLDAKLAELKETESVRLKQDKELKEVNAELIAKIAIIDTLQADKRRLEEAKAQLQTKLDQLLGKKGLEIAPVTKVTQPFGVVKPADATAAGTDTLAKPIALKGTITVVDIKNSIAQISIGSANGVREKMKFLVTRNSQFICEILIIDVEPERAVGFLQRVKAELQPKVGDNVSTNL